MQKESNLPSQGKAATGSISLSEFDKKTGFVRSGEVETLHGYHVDFSLEWAHSNASNLAMTVQSMSIALFSTFESIGNLSHHENTLVGVCMDACTMAFQVLEEFKNRLVDAFDFYKSYAKLTYILTRIFRTLIAKGFCSDKSEENDSSDANADGTKFEDDVEGTGMGEGVGMRDVTDQIENEEQILGLKEDLPEKNESQNHEQRQLDEDEKDKGMEMENDLMASCMMHQNRTWTMMQMRKAMK
jgi:midasin (ATPase involved in ribosome maturation)